MRRLVAAAAVCGTAASAHAQPAARARPDEHRLTDAVTFLAGAGVGFVLHESGHLAFDVAFDARPRFEHVAFGPVPFFAITPRADLSPRREFVVASAGLWVQEATSEWLLTRHPALRQAPAPFRKGVLAFDLLTSVGYAAVAFARAGPPQRDTRGMAAGVGLDERAIGALVLAPAVLDGWRYARPESAWAKWASRVAKAGSVLLVLK